MAVTNVLRKPFTEFQNVAIGEKQAIAKTTAVAMAVDAPTLSTSAIRAQANLLFNGADLAGQTALTQTFSLEQMAGIIESGAIDQLPTDLAQIAKDRYMVLRHIAVTGLQSQFQRQPTANDPTACGADVDAAMADAQQALDALKARGANVDAAANVLRDATVVVAVACDLSTDQAFALLTGNQLPSDKP
jgi:hypothetical protein